jgi:hypothetical protein
MSSRSEGRMPQHLREEPPEVQIAVLYERVSNLTYEVRGLKRALWAVAITVIAATITFLFSLANGLLGHHP